MRQKQHTSSNEAFALIEIVVASAIVSMLIAGLLGMAQFSLRAENALVSKSKALFLAEEGLEVLRILRDESWSENLSPLSSGTTYYPVFAPSSGSWSLSAADPGPVDGTFTRAVVLNDVYRSNANQDIIASTSPGAVLDDGTKNAKVRMTWSGDVDGVELETYIADLFNN